MTPVAATLDLLLRVYQHLTVGLPHRCRFYPSCSQYAREAIHTQGAARGMLLGFYRLCRCHPWHTGGADPAPTRTLGTSYGK